MNEFNRYSHKIENRSYEGVVQKIPINEAHQESRKNRIRFLPSLELASPNTL